MRRHLIAAALLFLARSALGAPIDVPSPASWRVVEETDGVRTEVADSPHGPWGRASGRVDVGPAEALRHLIEFEALVGRIPRLVEARVLQRSSDSALLYQRFDLPWPVSDRDYTTRYRWGELGDGRIALDLTDANELGPPEGRAIRVRDVQGRFLLTPLDGGKATQVDYVFHANFGGMLPRSVRERTAWRTAQASIQGMRKVLAKKR